jgi:excisionase family DNA binding protein
MNETKTTEMSNEPMTVAEVAKFLGVSNSWVRDHAAGRRRPVLPSWKTSSGSKGHFRFMRRSVEEWIDHQVKTWHQENRK